MLLFFNFPIVVTMLLSSVVKFLMSKTKKQLGNIRKTLNIDVMLTKNANKRFVALIFVGTRLFSH